ncbi:unnamed protein product [Brassica oleracea var. botrytis]|uniref:RRM domain-containing protein n=2 Tax=Brassica TaxID=3705 RepID=A0A0D3CW08_BRAOL|nr:PREDICTED: RNA-binding protein 24-like isoform X2 [Brassica oleracea var. oleracea]KAF3524737.1 hypothetical protein F2Q69_00050062 [Brassica cretica]
MYPTSYYRSPFGDTTYTKVFVGGLAWETPTEEMRRYFDQFGEILEAVIITDKNTGKSKGYGFVTFQEADSATRAVADPNPVIDGRKANCNIASFGRPRPSPPRGRGQKGSPSQYQSGGPSAYTGMAAPLPPASAAHQLMYPSYGYTYNPDQFRYHQLQQAQYYQQQQQLYGGGATSPSAATIMASPYYYGCSLPASRMPYQHHHPHLPQPYNPQQQQQQQHQRFTSPSFLVYPSSSPFSSPLQGLLSSTEESEAPQQVSAKVEATTTPESTSSNNKEPTSS